MRFFAYIDPGTGSMFIQAVFGIGLALGVMLRSTIKTLITKLRFASSRNSTDEEA